MDPNALEVMDGLETPPEGANIQLPFGFTIVGGGMELRGLPAFDNPERHKLSKHERTFKEVDIGNFSFQPPTGRIPPKDETGDIPRLASWRSNVVALSQRFNLYFVAYVDKIYIFIPRGLKHAISGTPDLILDLPRTDSAVKVGGYINQHRPHCVNHLRIGNLGNLEILLMACDDGDVLVYYTHLLQYELGELLLDKKNRTSNVQPFLLENVGISAWGLAIHEKSRLIAVGSNFREITLFLPAYTRSDSSDRDWQSLARNRLQSGSSIQAVYQDSSVNGFNRNRQSNYKVRYSLGLEGHNIPSLDFASHEDGDAEAILVADINGNLWVINIWDGTKKRIPRINQVRSRSPSPDGNEDQDPVPQDAMGWGVVSLPLSYFRTERTPYEAFGSPVLKRLMKKDKPRPTKQFDITLTTSMVNDSNKYHPLHPKAQRLANEIMRAQNCDDFLVENDDKKIHESAEASYDRKRYGLMNSLLKTELHISPHVFASTPKTFLQWSETKRWLANIIANQPDHPLMMRWVEESQERMNRFQKCRSEEMDDEIAKFRECIITRFEASKKDSLNLSKEKAKFVSEFLSQTLHPDKTAVILRTWNHDIQLLPSASNQLIGTICRGLVKQEIAPAQRHLAPFDRLNMLAVIPELSLVIVGSQIGRAALITLTKLEGMCEFGAIPMCRLDFILPLSRHEIDFRSTAPLLGLAVGPVPNSRSIWRVMLHYLDHTILTYELSRGDGDQLMVF